MGIDDLQRQRQQAIEKYKNRRKTCVSAVETVRELDRLDISEDIISASRQKITYGQYMAKRRLSK